MADGEGKRLVHVLLAFFILNMGWNFKKKITIVDAAFDGLF